MTLPSRPRQALTALLLVPLVASGAGAGAAMPLQAQIELPSSLGNGTPRTRPAPPPVKVAQAPRPESKPSWNELTPAQKQALAPLANTWSKLGEAHKRKWLAVSQNYPTMPAGEQARLHSRMAEWAALSPQQRTTARMNFAETQKVPVDDKKAKWEAYQALSPEEKRKLAADGARQAKPAAPPTAAAVKPVPPQKLARVPKAGKDDPRAPRIAVLPDAVDHNTLLPQQPGLLPHQP
jgi:hypothetical protein